MEREEKMSVNLWVKREHALAYLREREALPHRADAYEQVLALLPASVERILDLGTGDGILLELALADRPDATGVGVDFGEEMLRRARERFAADERKSVVEHDLASPLPELGSFDAVISSFAIHHLDPVRQQTLYGEVFERLRSGGRFVNAEHVASPTEELHHEFLALLGRTPDEDDPSNQLVGIEEHLTWLQGCGFVNTDCFWKWRELAIVAGTKP